MWRATAAAWLVLVGLVMLAAIRTASAQQSASVGVGDTVLELAVQTSPGAFVTVKNDGDTIGTFVAGPDGRLARSFAAQTPGIHQLSLFARDTSDRLTDTITAQVNLQQHFPTAVSIFLPATMRIEPAAIIGNQPLLVRGQAVPAGMISVYVDGRFTASVLAESNGSWSYSLDTSGYSAGGHDIFVKVVDSNGNQSHPTSKRVFTVIRPDSRPAPSNTATATRLLLPQRPTVPRIVSPSDGQIFTQSYITVTGEAQAHTRVEVWDSSSILGGVLSDYSGRWALPYDFLPGRQLVRARACVGAVCSAFSPETVFNASSRMALPHRLRAALEQYVFSVQQNSTVRLAVRITSGDKPYRISVDWGDGRPQAHSISRDSLELEHTYREAGRYGGRITINDSHSSQELHFTVDVRRPDERDYSLSIVLLIVLIVVLLMAAARANYWRRRVQ